MALSAVARSKPFEFAAPHATRRLLERDELHQQPHRRVSIKKHRHTYGEQPYNSITDTMDDNTPRSERLRIQRTRLTEDKSD